MPHPRQGYRNKAGDKVPSVTTIIGRFKESGALMQWAYRTGREHGDLCARGKDAPTSLYDVSGRAADIGTTVHLMVEEHIKGAQRTDVLANLDTVDDDYREKAISGYEAYLSWESMTHLKVIEQEMPLVSEEYQYAGCPDAIGEVLGELCLLDWKSSNGVYSDMLIQLAAYRQLWNENHPDRPLTGGSHLCRFSKEHGDFAHHYYPNLDDAWEQFKLFRQAYDIDKRLKKRAA